MNKATLKQRARITQQNQCAISGDNLSSETALFDAHRLVDKAEGGALEHSNVTAVDPMAHMQHHGIYRARGPWEDELKTLMDDRLQMMKAKQKILNQLLAYERRTDNADNVTHAKLQEMLAFPDTYLGELEKRIVKHLKNGQDPMIKIMLGVKGIGPMTVAGCLTYLDFSKADSPSAFWKYVGLHTSSHNRFTKGETSGGNKTLRCILWNMASSMVKTKGAYEPIYRATKERLADSDKITSSRNTQGALVQVAWKDAKPCHRQGAALRAVMKHFLADLWMVGRQVRGLSMRTLYAEQILSHDGIIRPEERGWPVTIGGRN